VDMGIEAAAFEYAFTTDNDVPASAPRASCCVGRITEISSQGVVMVDFVGSPRGPRAARSTLWSSTAEAVGVIAPFRCTGGLATIAYALLAFEDTDPTRPIIVGLLPPHDARPLGEPPPVALALRVSVDGKCVTIAAGSEIALVCGKSSIVLTSDGKIVIKGANLLSRSSGGNRIRGATVQLN